MRAVVHHEFGEPTEVLAVEEVPTPEPGPGEVRVRTVLSAVHNHDLWTIRGTYGFKPELPARAGTEAVGVVDALGEGTEGVQIGQRVAVSTVFGVWSEYFVARAAQLIPVPDAISDEAAAQLVAMPFSALSLIDFLGLKEGDWIVQNAANGAVGRLVAQLAKPRGINVLGLVRRAEAVTELEAHGIGNVVATGVEGWQEKARAITGDAVALTGVDSVGGSAAGDVVSLLGDGGTLVVFGAMASPTMELPSGAIIFRDLTVRGFWGSQVSKKMAPEKRRELITELITRAADGSLTLPVDAVFPFEKVREASTANFTAGRDGKVLLKP
ncbi:zinc-binding dehydrogenase [Kineosporia succinea]|uniref:enoyl-[acyl-carrier-protein] reductase n=1 Tax=Kineosporia succinea TaxID=84632 RepID=A0ABT9PDC4_9ACTN|nr:zinc-binding dehydrogenase [Kineosporia succinea]MDP9830708.1 NADPH:quinone reductase-like Zn-dependent oxidoreductase [Kineosporia succinea]